MEQSNHNSDTIAYTWFRLENSLQEFFKANLNELPAWAKKKGYTQLIDLHQVYKQRLIYEFDIVRKMGFLGYFLIVSDVIEFCRDSSIPTGPGRGSGAGSLMGFLLQITKIDPIRYGLLFERFLNPDRYSMPDYDLDISQLLRGKVKEHLEVKYGRDHVASIGTFSRMKVRAAVKDIVRSLNLGGSTSESFRLADKISKTLDEEDDNLTLCTAMKSPEFKQYMDKYPEVYQHVERCENVLRQMSMHAAGVLISALPLDQELPLIVDKNGMVVTAYDGKTVETLGYLKLDTLGLKNLDIIDSCRKSIQRIRGRIPEMSFDGIEFDIKDDPKEIKKRIEQIEDEKTRLASRTYEYLRTGPSTLGIFQCDQAVTQDLLRRGLTNSIEDGAAVIALIRPGPRKAGSTDIFISRKRLEEPLAFFEPHPEVFSNEKWEQLVKIRFPQKYQEYLSAEQEEKNKILVTLLREAIVDGKMNENLQGKQGTENIGLQFAHPEDDLFLQEAPTLCHYAEMLLNPESKGFDFSFIAPVCVETQGLPLYQEQIMEISVKCAGFTKGESDVLRKAVGKKDAKLIKQTGEKLVAGLIKNGASEFTAWYLWTKYILPYGSYGFNKSHSISYFAISYETAWLKANFPCEFYAALLSFEENQDSINDIIVEAKKQGIVFVPPDVNKSTDSFAPIDEKTIAYSLTCMKGIGPSVAKRIANRRPYIDMVDFLARSRINLGATKILIKSGAFDNAFTSEKVSRKNYFDFAYDCVDRLRRQTDRLLRESMVEKYGYIPIEGLARKKAKEAGTYESIAEFHDRMCETNDKYKEEYDTGFHKKSRAFAAGYEWTAPMKVVEGKITELVKRESEDERDSWTKEEHYLFEEEIFGVSLSGHRMDVYKNREDAFFETCRKKNVKFLRLSDSLDSLQKGDVVYVYGMLSKLSRKSPYKKDPSQYMRAFSIEDRFGKTNVSIFEQDFRNTKKDEKLTCYSNDKAIHKGPFWLVEKKNSDPRLSSYNPIVILKCTIGEFAGRKGLNYSSVGDWVNKKSISEDLIRQRQLELQEIQEAQKQIDEQVKEGTNE